jgi:Protein of unknown function (DUF2786)
MNRESVLDKIRALLAKTTANGCTQEEMAAALAKARAMRDTYAISDSELQLAKDEAAILRHEPADPNDPHNIKWRLCSAVAEFCDCEVWAEPDSRNRKLTFCGTASDTQWAAWLLDHLTDYVSSELVLHLMTSFAPKSERRDVIRGFIIGATEQISARLTELCEPPADQANNSRALMVLKSAAIEEKMKECGITLRCSSSRSSSFDHGAYGAGQKAGKGASFGRPVSGAAGALRLGKA